MVGYFMTKPTQGVAFKILWDQLMGVTKAQYPGPGKPKKYHENEVSKHVQKEARNAAPAQN